MRRVALITCLSLALLASPAAAGTYTVGTTDDPAGACGSGPCSLRQLIAKVHATPFPPDTINVPAGTYTLDATLGALVITDNVAMVGAGAKTTTIAMPVPPDRSSQGDRVFDIQVPSGGATPTVAIKGLTITGGTAHPGNGFFGGNIRSSGTLTLSDAWITNGSGYSGGGVANQKGTLTVERSLISGNRAPYGGGDGGGIQNFGVPASSGPPPTPDLPSHLIVNDSTVTGNDARLVGGIFSWGDDTNTLVVTNSTIAGNATQDEPGGAARESAGGGIGVHAGTEVVRNSIIAGNVLIEADVRTPRNCGPFASGGITSLGHNLDSGSDCNFTGVGDLSNTDPLLGPLQDNGGPTQTFALGAGSPALDRVPASGAGCSGTDQRGIPRPQGPACDIGAFELGVVPASTAAPGISGSPVRGQTLTESHGGWAYGPTGFAYQWLRCNAEGALCGAIPGATGHTYALTAGDEGSTIRVQELASNAFGSSSPATSAATAVVSKPPPVPLGATAGGSYLFHRGGRTRIVRLYVGPLPAGTTVVLSCKSQRKAARKSRCPFKNKTFTVGKATAKLQLAKHFKKRKLARKTRIEIRATKPETIGLVARFKTRRLKVPVKRLLCLPPEASKPVKCG